MEARRAVEYISHDQAKLWQAETRRGQERVQAAKIAMHNAKTFKTVADHVPSLIEEKKELEKQQRRLKHAEDKVEAVRYWSRIAEQASASIRRNSCTSSVCSTATFPNPSARWSASAERWSVTWPSTHRRAWFARRRANPKLKAWPCRKRLLRSHHPRLLRRPTMTTPSSRPTTLKYPPPQPPPTCAKSSNKLIPPPADNGPLITDHGQIAMIVGDLHSGAGKLEQAIRNLQLHWELTRQMWHDSASRSFEDNHLADLLPQVKTVLELHNASPRSSKKHNMKSRRTTN